MVEESYQSSGINLKIIEINDKLSSKITKYYEKLLNSYFPFDAMCWALAELELIFEKGHKNYSQQELTEKAEEIFDVEKNYDNLCWLIANLKIYLEEVNLYP